MTVHQQQKFLTILLRATNLRRRASHPAFAARLVEEPGQI